jgi:aminodeoxyfutalosine synthase
MIDSLFKNSDLADIAEKVSAGERLSFEDGVRLYRSPDIHAVGALAQTVRQRINERRVYYSANLHLNHTNICSISCMFCSFSRKPGEPGGYAFSLDEMEAKVRKAISDWGINEVHIVGGHHPDLYMDYYVQLFKRLRALDAHLYIKALTAPEIDDLAVRCKISHEEVLKQLMDAGLDGMPGGGAEIFAEKTRQKICREKITASEWLAIHEKAHGLGLRTNCTMLYGHIESDEDRVDHVLRLRALQDRTQGFQSFILLSYQAENNRLSKLGEPGGLLDLKALAVSRLLFDNVPHIKAHWTTTNLKFAQVALSFGCDDLGGLNLNEKIMHDAGSETPLELSRGEMERLIRDAGYEPCLVDSSYKIKNFEPAGLRSLA